VDTVETAVPQDDTPSPTVQNGDACTVTGGVHAGKSGVVEDRNVSKTGQVTITVRLADGGRFKTLARNVVVRP
jgi:ribosomal protein S4E